MLVLAPWASAGWSVVGEMSLNLAYGLEMGFGVDTATDVSALLLPGIQ